VASSASSQAPLPPSAPSSPLAVPVYRALWLAGVVSFIGSFVQNIGEAWLMLDLTKSPLRVAMLSTTFVGASVFMLLPAGALADRRDKRSVALASQVVQAVAALAMAFLSYTGHISPEALMAGVALLGIGMALGAPAWAALNTELLPRELVAEGVALNAIAFNVARAVGPAIGGVVLEHFGATVSFTVNAVSFGVVAAALVRHRKRKDATAANGATGVDEPPPPSRKPLARTFSEPLAQVVRDAPMRATFLAMFGFTLGASLFYALLPAFGKNTLSASALSYGVMVGMMGAGAILGATALKPLRPRFSPQKLVVATIAIFATSSMLLSRVSSIPAAMLLLVPTGAGWTGTFASVSALAQIWSPDRLRARMMALYQLAHLATWALGATAGGVIAERYGVRAALATGGAVCAAAALSTWRLPLPTSFGGERRQSGSRQSGSRQSGSRQSGSRQSGSRQSGSRQSTVDSRQSRAP